MPVKVAYQISHFQKICLDYGATQGAKFVRTTAQTQVWLQFCLDLVSNIKLSVVVHLGFTLCYLGHYSSTPSSSTSAKILIFTFPLHRMVFKLATALAKSNFSCTSSSQIFIPATPTQCIAGVWVDLWVMHRFFMGYGYGYKIFNLLKTRTRTAYPCTHPYSIDSPLHHHISAYLYH